MNKEVDKELTNRWSPRSRLLIVRTDNNTLFVRLPRVHRIETSPGSGTNTAPTVRVYCENNLVLTVNLTVDADPEVVARELDALLTNPKHQENVVLRSDPERRIAGIVLGVE